MSLHDIDPHNLDRSAPLPSTHDVQIQESVKAHATESVNYLTDSSTAGQILDSKNGQFTIVQVGNFTTTATYSTTNPGAGNFAADVFNIYQVAHGLSYTPGLLSYEQTSTGQYSPMPYTRYQIGTAAQALWYTWTMAVDATNVYIQLNSMTAGAASFTFNPGFIFKWYLLKQTAN